MTSDQDSTRVGRLASKLAGIFAVPDYDNLDQTETVGDSEAPSALYLNEEWVEEIDWIEYKEEKYALADVDDELVLAKVDEE